MKKRNHLKSIISLLLISLILIGCFPVTAGAKSRVTDLEIEPALITENTSELELISTELNSNIATYY